MCLPTLVLHTSPHPFIIYLKRTFPNLQYPLVFLQPTNQFTGHQSKSIGPRRRNGAVESSHPVRCFGTTSRTSSKKIRLQSQNSRILNLILEKANFSFIFVLFVDSSIRQISIPLRSRDLHIQIRFPSGQIRSSPLLFSSNPPHLLPLPDQTSLGATPKEIPLKISDYIFFPGRLSFLFVRSF